MRWLLGVMIAIACVVGGPARAGGSAPGLIQLGVEQPAPIQAKKDKGEEEGEEEEELSPAEQAELERMQAIAEANSTAPSRVIVLEWPNSDVNYSNESIQRNVRARIERADAQFYPEVDLYQNGRREPDKSLRPEDQRASVPLNIDAILDAVEEAKMVPWEALDPMGWQRQADQLYALLEELWFVDRPELRQPLFELYLEIGRAANNMRNDAPPYFRKVGPEVTNYYYYLAATLAAQDKSLMSKVHDADTRVAVNYYLEKIEQEGYFDPLTLSFESEGEFDAESFAKQFVVYINGDPTTITSPNGQINVPPARTDVYLERPGDGHSLSQRVELTGIDDEVIAPRDDARRRMGDDFLEELMVHPNECQPDLSGDIITYLAIYAKLHPTSEIYIAVPKEGNPNKLFIWRWERDETALIRVQGGIEFPIRFVLQFNFGTVFDGVGASADFADDATVANSDDPTDAAGLLEYDAQLNISSIPLNFQLRGHFSRLMLSTGVQWGYGMQGKWTDYYKTDYFRKGYLAVVDPTAPVDTEDTTTTATGTTAPTVEGEDFTLALKQRSFSTLWYGGLGIVFLRNAAIGLGPRLWFRAGYHQIPNLIDTTLHAAWTAQIPLTGGDRVRPVVDIDLFGGLKTPLRQSVLSKKGADLYADVTGLDKEIKQPYPTFGLTVGIGTTF